VPAGSQLYFADFTTGGLSGLVERLAPFAAIVTSEFVKDALTREIGGEIARQLSHLLADEPDPNSDGDPRRLT
jgi:hypothetical protein